MQRYRKTIKAGAVLEVEVSCAWNDNPGRSRGKKINKSGAAKQVRNYRNSVRLLSQLINANFTREDRFATLTHHSDVTVEEAEKALDKFIRDAQKLCRLLNYTKLKYIAVTENKHKEEKYKKKCRIHHHIIISGLDYKLIDSLWSNGSVIQSNLFGKDFEGLARYITKDPVETHKKKWRQSRGNLIHPVPEYKPARAEDSTKRPIRTPKGYRCVFSKVDYYEEVGVWKYAKFIKNGEIDLSVGTAEDPLKAEKVFWSG